MPVLLTIFAFILLAITPILGHYSQKAEKKWLFRLMILALIFGSFYMFKWTNGFEYALFFSLFLVTIPAYFWIYLNSTLKPEKPTKRQASYQNTASGWYKLLVMMLAGPLALTMAIVVATAISYLLPLLTLNRLVVMIMMVPLLWGLMALWLTATTHLTRTSVVLISISCLSLWGLQCV